MGMGLDEELEQWRTQKTWQESLEQLKEMIPGLYPQWTDYNLHDPGMTLMELAAWLGQLQMYRMRQINREHKKGFLKLLGVRPVKPKPGKSYVTVASDAPLFLEAGTRFYADHIPFETREAQMVSEGMFRGFAMKEGNGIRKLKGEWLREGRGISIEPFGPSPRPGNWMEIHLLRPLQAGVDHRLYMGFSHFGKRAPVPVDQRAYDGHGYYPLADIRMEYLTPDGWREAKGPVTEGPNKRGTVTEGTVTGETVTGGTVTGMPGQPGGTGAQDGSGSGPRDDTYGFIQDGSILFSLDLPMREDRPCLRFFLVRTDYIEAPCITRISLAMARVWQQETVGPEELPVFHGNGFPCQDFELGEGWMDEDKFVLWAQCPVPGGFKVRAWEQKEDFHGSRPEDCHYVLEDGLVRFGNGMNGMVPEGRIWVKRMVRTLGDKGNIKSGTIDRMGPVPGLTGKVRILHEMDVEGGAGRETPEQALERFCREQEERRETPGERAVTLQDYERLVMRAPGLMIEDCRAYCLKPEEKEIILAVKPCSRKGKAALTPGYVKNIYRFLEEKRMIGTKLCVVSPDYYDVTIACMVCARVQYRMADRMVEEAVKGWVGSKGFGEGIPYGQLLGMIDSLPCVQQVNSLWLDSGSRGRRTPRGDLLIPRSGLLHLKKVTCSLTTPMREGL